MQFIASFFQVFKISSTLQFWFLVGIKGDSSVFCSSRSSLLYLYKGNMTVNFMCQLDQGKGCVFSWTWFLAVFLRGFLAEMSICSIWIGLPSLMREGIIQAERAWLKGKGGDGVDLQRAWCCFSGLWIQTLLAVMLQLWLVDGRTFPTRQLCDLISLNTLNLSLC